MKSLFGFQIVALATVLLSVLPSVTPAQTKFAGGLYFTAGFPQGDFKDQIDRNAYGLGGQFFYSPQRSPLALGLELSWMNYGNESRLEPFSTTAPDVTVEVQTSNNLIQGFLILRAQMPRGPFRLYSDAVVGLNNLFTETSISDMSGGADIASTTNQEDVAFAYGLGGGVLVPIYISKLDIPKPVQVLLDGGLRYLLGGEAEYLKKGSIRREDGNVTYDLIKSKTDMVRLHVGVIVRF
jgi:hypothetical protein